MIVSLRCLEEIPIGDPGIAAEMGAFPKRRKEGGVLRS